MISNFYVVFLTKTKVVPLSFFLKFEEFLNLETYVYTNFVFT